MMEKENSIDFVGHEKEKLPAELQRFLAENQIDSDEYTVYIYRKSKNGLAALDVLHGQCPTLEEVGETYGSGRYQIRVSGGTKKDSPATTIAWNLTEPIWDERKRERERREAEISLPRNVNAPAAPASGDTMQAMIQGMQLAQNMMAPMMTALSQMVQTLAGKDNNPSQTIMREVMATQMQNFEFLKNEQANLLSLQRQNAGVKMPEIEEEKEEQELSTKELVKYVVQLVVEKGAEFMEAKGLQARMMKGMIKATPEFNQLTSDPGLLQQTIDEITRETGDPEMGAKVLQKLGVAVNGAAK